MFGLYLAPHTRTAARFNPIIVVALSLSLHPKYRRQRLVPFDDIGNGHRMALCMPCCSAAEDRSPLSTGLRGTAASSIGTAAIVAVLRESSGGHSSPKFFNVPIQIAFQRRHGTQQTRHVRVPEHDVAPDRVVVGKEPRAEVILRGERD